MVKKRFEVDIPEGQHLGRARDSDGTRALLFDDKTNKLVAHAELREVDVRAKTRQRQATSREADTASGQPEEHVQDQPDGYLDLDSQPDFDHATDDAEPSAGWGQVLGVAAVLGVAIAAAKGVQHVQNRDDEKQGRRTRKRSAREPRADASLPRASLPPESAAAAAGWYPDPYDGARLRYWDGQVWTGHTMARREGAPARGLPATPTRDVSAAHREPTVSMATAEWQQRLRAMLLARAFSEEQLRLLSHARIDDPDPALLELQHALAGLSPQELSHRVRYMLEANPAALTDTEAELVRLLGGAGKHAHLPSGEAAHVAGYEQGAVERATRAPAPARWYDDDRGHPTWWDGHRWITQASPSEHLGRPGPRLPAPAGWYDDGSGRMRWWDGQRWR